MKSCAATESFSMDARPEVRALLWCVRGRLALGERAPLDAEIQSSLDWQRLVDTALQHKVAPLVYSHLEAVCPGVVPVPILKQLRDRFRWNALRNLRLTQALLKALDLFETSRIPVIAYKGPVLAAAVYGDIPLRQFDDVDILIRRGDLPRALEALAGQGYTAPLSLPPPLAVALSQSESHCAFCRTGERAVLELHWQTMPEYLVVSRNSESVWERLQEVSIPGRRVLTLSPEDLLSVLCVRGSRFLWRELRWVCDVAGLISSHKGMKWEQCLAEADAMGITRMLFLGLRLAADLLGGPVPPWLRREIESDPQVGCLTACVLARLTSEKRRAPYSAERVLWHLSLRERLSDKIQYCLRRGLSPTLADHASLPVPACAFPLHYASRPIRLAAQCSVGAVMHLARQAMFRTAAS